MAVFDLGINVFGCHLWMHKQLSYHSSPDRPQLDVAHTIFRLNHNPVTD